MLEKYLKDIWIFPRERLPYLQPGIAWVLFEGSGGVYTVDWMVQAATDRIQAKIKKHQHDNIRTQYALDEFDLLCSQCDEAILHNTPIRTVGFGFNELADEVELALGSAPKVFDRIFLFHPYENTQAVQVFR